MLLRKLRKLVPKLLGYLQPILKLGTTFSLIITPGKLKRLRRNTTQRLADFRDSSLVVSQN